MKKKRLHVVIDGDLFKAFKALSTERDAPMTALIRRAMREFITRVWLEKAESHEKA